MTIVILTAIVGIVIMHALQVKGDTLCPDRWMAYQGSCYLFEESLLDITQAEQFCRNRKSHLIHITHQAENTFIKSELNKRKWQAWWIGCTDEEAEGTWTWTDLQTPVFPNETDWYPGQPNGDGDCAVFLQPYGFRWEDTDCLGKVMPICELLVGIS